MKKLISILFLLLFSTSVFGAKLYVGGEKYEKEGVVALSGNDNITSLIEVNCETDFVAKNDDFVHFVKELSEINLQCKSDIEQLKNTKMKNGMTVDENLIAIVIDKKSKSVTSVT